MKIIIIKLMLLSFMCLIRLFKGFEVDRDKNSNKNTQQLQQNNPQNFNRMNTKPLIVPRLPPQNMNKIQKATPSNIMKPSLAANSNMDSDQSQKIISNSNNKRNKRRRRHRRNRFNQQIRNMNSDNNHKSNNLQTNNIYYNINQNQHVQTNYIDHSFQDSVRLLFASDDSDEDKSNNKGSETQTKSESTKKDDKKSESKKEDTKEVNNNINSNIFKIKRKKKQTSKNNEIQDKHSKTYLNKLIEWIEQNSALINITSINMTVSDIPGINFYIKTMSKSTIDKGKNLININNKLILSKTTIDADNLCSKIKNETDFSDDFERICLSVYILKSKDLASEKKNIGLF